MHGYWIRSYTLVQILFDELITIYYLLMQMKSDQIYQILTNIYFIQEIARTTVYTDMYRTSHIDRWGSTVKDTVDAVSTRWID